MRGAAGKYKEHLENEAKEKEKKKVMPHTKLASKVAHKRKLDEQNTKAREDFARSSKKRRQQALEQLAAAARKKKAAAARKKASKKAALQ